MWTVDYTTRIYTQELGSEVSQILPRLQPLAGGTVIQRFGHETDIYKLKCKVVGYTDLNILKSYVQDGLEHTISEVASGVPSGYMYFKNDFYFKGVRENRNKSIQQTLRTDLDCYTPVFDVELELYKE